MTKYEYMGGGGGVKQKKKNIGFVLTQEVDDQVT